MHAPRIFRLKHFNFARLLYIPLLASIQDVEPRVETRGAPDLSPFYLDSKRSVDISGWAHSIQRTKKKHRTTRQIHQGVACQERGKTYMFGHPHEDSKRSVRSGLAEPFRRGSPDTHTHAHTHRRADKSSSTSLE